MSVFKAVIKDLITLRCYVFTAMKIYIVILSVMTPPFWRYILPQLSLLKVEAVSFSETPVPTYRLQRDLITQNITV
jgi:hypothetical protein